MDETKDDPDLSTASRGARPWGWASLCFHLILLAMVAVAFAFGAKELLRALLSALLGDSFAVPDAVGPAGLVLSLTLAAVLSVVALRKAQKAQKADLDNSMGKRWAKIMWACLFCDVLFLGSVGVHILGLAIPRPSCSPVFVVAERPSAPRGVDHMRPHRPGRPPPPRPIKVLPRGRAEALKTLEPRLDSWWDVLAEDRTALTRQLVTEHVLSRGGGATGELIETAQGDDPYVTTVSLSILVQLVRAHKVALTDQQLSEIGAAASRSSIEAHGLIHQELVTEMTREHSPDSSRAAFYLRALKQWDVARNEPPQWEVTLRSGQHIKGALLAESFAIVPEGGKRRLVAVDEIKSIRFGALANEEPDDLITGDKTLNGFVDVAVLQVKTASRATAVDRADLASIKASASEPPFLFETTENLAFAHVLSTAWSVGDSDALAKALDERLTTFDPPAAVHQFPAEVEATALVKGSHLLAAGDQAGHLNVYLLRSGKLAQIAQHTLGQLVIHSRPLIEGTVAYVGVQSTLNREGGMVALDLLTGQMHWYVPIGSVRHSNVARLGDLLFVTSQGTGHMPLKGTAVRHRDEGLYAVDRATGQILWTLPLVGLVHGNQSPQVSGNSVEVLLRRHERVTTHFERLTVAPQDGTPQGQLHTWARIANRRLIVYDRRFQNRPQVSAQGMQCVCWEGPSPTKAWGATLRCSTPGGPERTIDADCWEWLSYEYERPVVVDGLVLVGDSMVDVRY